MALSKISKRNKTLIAGVASALVCAACVGIYIHEIDQQASAAQAEILRDYGGDQVDVCVAKHDIVAGETITDMDIETRTWVSSLLPADAVTLRGDAVGKLVGSTILSGEVISSKRFGLETADIDIPAGLTAVSVPAKDVQAVGGAIKSGMQIDVYAIGSSTKRIASRVLVLTTSYSEDVQSTSNSAWITLAVEPTSVEEIVASAQNLELYFVIPSSSQSQTSPEGSEKYSANTSDPNSSTRSDSPEASTAASKRNEEGSHDTPLGDAEVRE